jgi:hypothetical protein
MKPAPRAQQESIPEAVTNVVNEPQRRRDDDYATPAEYRDAVTKAGHRDVPPAAVLIPSDHPWIAQLQSAPTVAPFESHRIGLAGEVERAGHCSWVGSGDPALARGVDLRLWKDTLTHKVVGAVSFGPDATQQAQPPPLAQMVAPAALQMAMGEAAEEAVKLTEGTILGMKELSLSMLSIPKAGVTYRLQASVSGVEGPVIHASASLTDALDDKQVAVAAIDFVKLA